MIAGNLFRMVPEHAAYRIMDIDMPWAEDVEDAGEGGARNVKNKFFNRAFAWMFHRAVCDSSCSLGWLLPKAALEANAAVDELCSRLIPDEDGEESRLVGPVLLATFAWAVMCTPWYSFKGLQEKPSHEVWFNQQLDFYSKWGPEAANERIATGLKLFYEAFPESRKLANRRKSGGIIHESKPSRAEAREDISSLPPACD
jgi:hypothetical protein